MNSLVPAFAEMTANISGSYVTLYRSLLKTAEYTCVHHAYVKTNNTTFLKSFDIAMIALEKFIICIQSLRQHRGHRRALPLPRDAIWRTVPILILLLLSARVGRNRLYRLQLIKRR